MNIITREIAERFKVDANIASQIQDVLECDVYLDYSEATQTQIDAAYDEAYALWMQANGVLTVVGA